MKLTFMERLACTVLSHLEYDHKTNEFLPTKRNGFILSTAKFILNGNDPIDFIAFVLSKEEDHPGDPTTFVSNEDANRIDEDLDISKIENLRGLYK